MTDTTYIVTTKIIKVEESDICSYGIKCIFNEGNYDINDISTNKDLVEKAAEEFNQYELSPHHFTDAVEDLLVSISSI